jgi:hypothetical protein
MEIFYLFFYRCSLGTFMRAVLRTSLIAAESVRRQPDYPETALCHVPQLERAPALPQAMDLYHTVPSPSTVHVQSKARDSLKPRRIFFIRLLIVSLLHRHRTNETNFRNFPPTIPLVNPGYLRFRFHLL